MSDSENDPGPPPAEQSAPKDSEPSQQPAEDKVPRRPADMGHFFGSDEPKGQRRGKE